MGPFSVWYEQAGPQVILIFLVVLVGTTEIGFRRGRRAAPGLGDITKAELSTLQAAMMGLLALMLAFTFAMADSRFAGRKRLVVDESNAIGTAFMRSQMLPEPYKGETAKTFRDYVDQRIEAYSTNVDDLRLEVAKAITLRLQKALRQQAIDAARTDPHSIPIGLFINALNDMFDLQARRDADLSNPVPSAIFYLLFLASVVTMELVGYSCGVGTHRNLPITITIAVLISLVVLVIVDLDTPRRGFIKVSQQTMIDLRADLE